MTEPTIMKAMEYLDEDLIAEAAERKPAPRFTKKKALVLLAACFLLILSFVMMGTEEAPERLPSPHILYTDEMRRADFDMYIEQYKETNPEEAAYYAKWRDIDIPCPYPEEWYDEYGYFKDFVTVDMLYEKYHGSLLEEFHLDSPVIRNGEDQTVIIELEGGVDFYVVAATIAHGIVDESGNVVDENGNIVLTADQKLTE